MHNFAPLGKYRLLDWMSLRTQLLWIYEGAPGMLKGSSTVTGSFAWLITQGAVRVATEKSTAIAKTGQWMFPPHQIVPREFSQDARILSVHFQARWGTGQELFEPDAGTAIQASDRPILEERARAMLAVIGEFYPERDLFLAFQRTDFSIHLRLQQLLLGWIGEYAAAMLDAGWGPSRNGYIEERMYSAREMIDSHSLDRRLDQKRIASALAISTSQLERLFSAAYSLSPRSYHERRRVEHACLWLKRSNRPIKQLAIDLGFDELPHFSHWFRRHVGKSPRAYRESGEYPSSMLV